MELNQDNLKSLSECLEATLSPDATTRRGAERILQGLEQNAGYSVLLLYLVQKADVGAHVRVAGSVALKNFVKRNWKGAEGENSIPLSDRSMVKREIVQLMLTAPEPVQRQTSEAISLIGRVDFPDQWEDLMPTLVQHLSSDDPKVVNSVLQTAHSLFKRYRHEMKSDNLWLEIKYVLGQFADPLTQLFKRSAETAVQQAGQSAEALTPLFQCLFLTAKIFNSLNAQDLPEFFEDNMDTWMPGFLSLLKLDVPALVDSNSDESGLVESLRSQICENIAMYAQKYEEEFSPHLPPFVEVVWNLLVSTPTDTKYDLLVANAIQFLSTVAEREKYKELFTSAALQQICEKVVVPNMELRESDVELFEDNPEEFIRKDIEGSDVDTRRRSAADLVKALCRFFEVEITQIFSGYIQQLFTAYAANPNQNWNKKEVGVFLVTSLVSKGSTQKHGATKTSTLVNVEDFFLTQIATELNGDVNLLPVLKASAIKYVVTFRNKLSKPVLVQALNAVTKFLTSNSVVVHSYAAHAMERCLTIRDPANRTVPLIQYSDLSHLTNELLQGLFGIFEKQGSKENEYAMKSVMRCLSLFQTACATHREVILGRLTGILVEVAKNPSKPYFNHYLFESLCVLIKQACKSENVEKFEEALFPPFQEILTNDVLEFMPYIFQILAMMLGMRQEGQGIPEPYMALYGFLLAPKVWELTGSIPALVLLLQSYIRVGFNQIKEQLDRLLGVMQKLVASKLHDHEGFKILKSLFEFGDQQEFRERLQRIVKILLTRLQKLRTVKFSKNLIVFMCIFAIKVGCSALISTLEALQEGLFGMFLEKALIADLQKIDGRTDKKVCCVGITRLILETKELQPNGKYHNYCPALLEGVVGLFELPEDVGDEDDEQLLELDDLAAAQGYTAAFSQLAYGQMRQFQSAEFDPSGVPDAKLFLVSALKNANDSRPGEVTALLGKIQPQAAQFIRTYLANAGVTGI